MKQHNEQSEILQSNSDLTDKENSSKNKELIKREVIDNSPLIIITTEEGSFATIGHYRITDITDYETIKGMILANNYDLLCGIIIGLVRIINEQDKETKSPEQP